MQKLSLIQNDNEKKGLIKKTQNKDECIYLNTKIIFNLPKKYKVYKIFFKV